MYDLRWAPDKGQATRPYLPFPQYIGMDIPRFDLNSELGLLVARKFDPPMNNFHFYLNINSHSL
jgi:hypothetical protein